MNEQQAISTPQPAVTSFMTRMTNVFMGPSELFSELATAPPQTSSWLMPLFVTTVLSMVFTYVLFSNPSFRHQMMEAQTAAMQEQVAKGQMTQENADRASEIMESGNIVLFTGLFGSLIVPAIIMLLAALFLWLVLKVALKSPSNYKKAMELYGLASLVGGLGVIVSLILIHAFDTIHATPSGALLVVNVFDRTNFTHKLLSSLTVFGIWQTAVIGIGLAKISGKSNGTGLGVAFVLWALIVGLSAVTGFGVL